MITVETTADFVGCGACGIRAVAHERKLVAIRDLACFGRPARLVWRKRRWRCVEPACEAKTWTEDSEHVDAQVVLTRRAGAEPEARDRFEQWFTQLERFIREEIALVPMQCELTYVNQTEPWSRRLRVKAKRSLVASAAARPVLAADRLDRCRHSQVSQRSGQGQDCRDRQRHYRHQPERAPVQDHGVDPQA